MRNAESDSDRELERAGFEMLGFFQDVLWG
jgi:hypothetical protein